MKSLLCVSLLMLMMTSAHAASSPGDNANGKRLLDAHCMECHQTDIFTRKDRKIQSLEALKEQLADCTQMAEQEFSASEMHDLLGYLNDEFYRFD